MSGDGWYTLRKRCRCGCNVGRLRLVDGRLQVRCADCDALVCDASRAVEYTK